MLANTKSPVTHSIYRANLKEKISASQTQIHKNINAANASIIHRTQAINSKRPYQTLEEEQTFKQFSANKNSPNFRTNLATRKYFFRTMRPVA